MNNLAVLIKTIGPLMQDVLRKRGGLFQMANTDFSTEAARKGNVINATFAAPLVATDVVPSPSGTQAPFITPTEVALTLNNWKEAPFGFTHTETQNTTAFEKLLSSQVEEGVVAIVDAMEASFFLEAHTNAGTQTFAFATGSGMPSLTSSILPIAQAETVLFDAKAPNANRNLVIASDVSMNLVQNPLLQSVSDSGTSEALRDNLVGRLSGFDVSRSHFVPTVGGLKANLAFQRAGLGIAVRAGNSGANTVVVSDPVSGVPMTLSVFPQEYQTKWAISAVWGSKVIRPTFVRTIWSAA